MALAGFSHRKGCKKKMRTRTLAVYPNPCARAFFRRCAGGTPTGQRLAASPTTSSGAKDCFAQSASAAGIETSQRLFSARPRSQRVNIEVKSRSPSAMARRVCSSASALLARRNTLTQAVSSLAKRRAVKNSSARLRGNRQAIARRLARSSEGEGRAPACSFSGQVLPQSQSWASGGFPASQRANAIR